jgi:hypothetical protein
VASLPGLGLLFYWEIKFRGIRGFFDRIDKIDGFDKMAGFPRGRMPVCGGLLLGSDGSEQADLSAHSRDSHAPFFCNAKSNFKETLV